MNEKEIVKEVMAMRKWSQEDLAEKAGFKSQSNVTGLLNRGANGMRIDKLAKMLKVMGCEIIIRDTMGSGKEWKVDL